MADVLVAGGVFREVLLGPSWRQVRLAGSGLYAALAAARAGADVLLVAPVGDEDRPTAQALCDELGVQARWLSVGAESATFTMDAAWWRPPRPQYKPAGPPKRLAGDAQAAGVLLMFGHPEWEPDREPELQALSADAELLWDRQGWLSRSPGPGPVAALRARRKILLGNTAELADALGHQRASIDLQALPADFDAWVLKDGPWGVHAQQRDGDLHSVAACDVRPRMAIGSGDVFAGALAAALAAGAELVDGCRTGVLAAGAALSSPDPLHPQPLDAPELRVPVRPSQRAAARGQLRAQPMWAAHWLAGEVENALGVPILATLWSAHCGDPVELVIELGPHQRAAVLSGSGPHELAEQLVTAGLEMVAGLMSAARGGIED